MVNSVPELSQRLVKALDEDYNVIDMRAVLEIIAVLEQTSVTEELLKTTRLGKLVNVLRKKTSNEELANRAKGLVKKWRKIALPLSNGAVANAEQQQTRTASSVVRNTNNNVHQYTQHAEAAAAAAAAVAFRNGTADRVMHRPDSRSQSPLVKNERQPPTIYVSDRSQSPMLVQATAAKRRMPGSDLVSQHNRFSDFTEVLDNQNSNSSFHSVISLDTSDADKTHVKHKKEKRASKKHKHLVSDFDSLSNTSESNAIFFPQRSLANAPPPKKSDLTFEGKINDVRSATSDIPPPVPVLPPMVDAPVIQTAIAEDKPAPKKRGRKKGSKLIGKPVVNSYSDIKQKIASISGKTKIKTTKELLADLQNRKSQGLSQSVTPTLVTASPLVTIEPPQAAAAPIPNVLPQIKQREPELETPTTANAVRATPSTSVMTTAPTISSNSKKRPRSETPEQPPGGPMTVQQILAQLPPLDPSFEWTEDPNEIPCTCIEHPASPVPSINTIAPAPKRSIFDEDYEEEPAESQIQLVAVPVPLPALPKIVEDPDCPAKAKYCDGPQNVTEDMLDRLHSSFIDGVNGNRDHGVASSGSVSRTVSDEGCVEVVPKYGTQPNGGLYEPLPKNPGTESDCVLVHSNIQFSERNDPDCEPPESLESRDKFKEWHEVVQRRSYHDELITVLPYVVID